MSLTIKNLERKVEVDRSHIHTLNLMHTQNS